MFTGMRIIPLGRQAIASKARPIVQLSTLSPKVRVRGWMLRAVLVITQGAGAVAITASTMNRLLASAVIGKRVRATGQGLDKLAWLTAGKDVSVFADVPAAAAVYNRTVDFYIPNADPESAEPLDNAPGAKMYSDESIELEFCDVASILGANTTITGTLKVYAETEPFDGVTVATPTRINYMDWTGQSVLMPRGIYSHIYAYKEDGTAITSAEITAVSMTVDGEQILNRVGIDDLVSQWNRVRGLGAAVQSLSATAPVGGEEFTDQPSVAGGGTDVVSVEVLPLIVTPRRYSPTHLLRADSQVQLDFEGSLTSFRIGYRQIEPQTADQVMKAGAKLGVGHLQNMTSKTLNGQSVDPATASILPKVLQ